VVLPSWDQSAGSLTACLDRALRIIGGAPAYLLTDNAKTVTIEHVAGARYYGFAAFNPAW
jgi:transposase